jgi:hypothetical protein
MLSLHNIVKVGSHRLQWSLINANDELPTGSKYMILANISEKCLLKKILEN